MFWTGQCNINLNVMNHKEQGNVFDRAKEHYAELGTIWWAGEHYAELGAIWRAREHYAELGAIFVWQGSITQSKGAVWRAREHYAEREYFEEGKEAS